MGVLSASIGWIGLPSAVAVPIQNSATGSANSVSLDLSNATVNLNQVPTGSAVASALAEISPNAVGIGSAGFAFTYDVLPTIGAGNTGVNQVSITAPAGYSNLLVTTVSVGGVSQGLNCPTPGAGQHCPTIAGQVITVTLGSNVTVTLTNIRVNFTANAPSTVGTDPFTSTVDDSATGAFGPQVTTAGNADGDAADANSIAVQVVGGAASSAMAEISPNTVTAGSPGNAFIYDILPTINGGDTGVDQVVITAPPGYGTLTVTTVSVNGTGQTPNCPTPGAGQYCSTVAGQVITVTLGDKVMTSLTNIRILFTASAPGNGGTADFGSMMDDTSTSAVAPQANATGDADGDPADLNSITVKVVNAADPDQSVIMVNPEIVEIDRDTDGTPYSTITVIPNDSNGNSIGSGLNVTIRVTAGEPSFSTLSAIQGGAPFGNMTIVADNGDGTYTAQVSSNVPGVAIVNVTVNGVILSSHPKISFTQGLVLEIAKTANKKEAVIGDVITYLVEIKNKTALDVVQVKIHDQIPPNFKYLKKSTRINKQPASDPVGNRTLLFDLGTVPGLVDVNANGKADPAEPGYMTLSYQLVIGSGAMPRDYINTAVAKDVCDLCVISNTDDAKVTVTLDPIFDLGTIIGKVFEDKDRDGRQGPDEPGVAGVMAALDDGTYALTDEHGRYHFPLVRPGQRMIKIDLDTLPAGAVATTDEARVVSVTPGLLAKANFGVLYLHGFNQSVGRTGKEGLMMSGESKKEAMELVGSVETLTVLVNGILAPLSTTDIQMGVEVFQEVVEVKGESIEKDVEFNIDIEKTEAVKEWKLEIMDAGGKLVRSLRGGGAPPKLIKWDGKTEKKKLVEGGEIYQYQLEIRYADGNRSASPRRMFGVNRSAAISLSLTGAAFELGSPELSPEAKKILAETAKVLRKYPQEKIVIEGHTDSTGSDEFNMDLSNRRAQSAVEFLIQTEKISRNRFVVKGYGKTRPMAANESVEGRELNRRVEVKGRITDVEKAKLLDQFRTQPRVRINGAVVPIEPSGRFETQVNLDGVSQLDIELANAQGRSLKAAIPVPSLEILRPEAESRLLYGAAGEGYRVVRPSAEGEWDPNRVAIEYRLLGRTDPGNTVELDGKSVPVESDGRFAADVGLKMGRNPFGIMVRNPSGYSRIANLLISISDRDESGRLVLAVEPIPHLTVQLPRPGVILKNPLLTVSGFTNPDHQVLINGRPATVHPDGHFVETVKLPHGKSDLVIEARDSDGRVGVIEREVEVSKTHLFFLGFADGKVGQLHGKGYLAGAGMEEEKEYYTEGRVAYYLKGVIAGRYLITSAFDTGSREFNRMFKDLDAAENDRLLINLDPDKMYPVYGDQSTLVYDTQSQGKFYLAVDSEEFHLLAGNYSLNLTETELGAYQRTFYGGRVSYQTASRTQYGQPDTTVVLFGAEVRQAHVRDELRATGGSLYYLSHRDVIEGSEQIAIVVRDKDTGLLLSRQPQQQNLDYTIKYEEGRVLFNRPIASVAESGSLVDQSLLSGNPVFIQVDFETRMDSFEKTARGGRVRQQIGDHLAVGGSYVRDELASGRYELKETDGEIRLGKNTRLYGEVAETSGTDSITFISEDGGLTFTELTPTGIQEGRAWKAAAELDVLEWFGAPNRVQVGGYLKRLQTGFLSSGNFQEQGTEKGGLHTKLQVTPTDKLLARYDREESIGGISLLPGAATESDLTTVQWSHDRGRLGLTGEYKARESLDALGDPLDRSSLGAARLRLGITEKLSTRLERQETITGPENDQTTVGIDYALSSALVFTLSGTDGTLGRAAQGGVIGNLDKGRIYLTERLADDQAGRTTGTVLGGETPIGPSSKVYSEYQWEQSDSGNRTVSLAGAQRHWDMGEGLRFLLAGEYSRINAEPKDIRRYTIAPGLSYSHPAGIKAMTREEVRRELGDTDRVQYLTTNALELRLNPDFTLVLKYRYSVTRELNLQTTEAEYEERSVGLAYRPVSHDRFNALARYTRLSDQRPLTPGETDFVVTSADVASIEWSFELNRYLEWVEKNAAKLKREETGDRPAVTTHTYLSIHRLNLNVWRALDLGLEYRILIQREADDQREGWLAEATWEVVTHLRLGVGYNFTDFSDNEFSENNYSVYGWFFRMQGKF